MTVTIHQCSNEHHWYAKHIHAIFEVRECGDPNEWALTDGSGRHIAKADCSEVIAELEAAG